MTTALATSLSTINAAITAGKTAAVYSTYDHATPTYVRNSNGLFYGLAGMSAIGVWESDNGGKFPCHLIGPSTVLMAVHTNPGALGEPPIGGTVRFVKTDGSNGIVTCTLANKTAITGADLAVGLLASPATGITPISILPDDWATKIIRLGAGLGVAWINQNGQVCLRLVNSITSMLGISLSGDPTWASFGTALIAGDSSAACLCPLGTSLVLLGLCHYGGSGAGDSIVYNAGAINTAIASIGGTDTLTRADLSSFTTPAADPGMPTITYTIRADGSGNYLTIADAFGDSSFGQYDVLLDIGVGVEWKGDDGSATTSVDISAMPGIGNLTIRAQTGTRANGKVHATPHLPYMNFVNNQGGGFDGPAMVTIDGIQTSGPMILDVSGAPNATSVTVNGCLVSVTTDQGAGTKGAISITTGASSSHVVQNTAIVCTHSQSGTLYGLMIESIAGTQAVSLYQNSINVTNLSAGVAFIADTGTTITLDSQLNISVGATTSAVGFSKTGAGTLNASGGHNVTSDMSATSFGSTGSLTGKLASAIFTSTADFTELAGSPSLKIATTSPLTVDQAGTVRPQKNFVDAGAMQSMYPAAIKQDYFPIVSSLTQPLVFPITFPLASR